MATQDKYLIDSTGTNRTVVSRLSEFVSVKDFGALGDGVTDDTTAVGLWLDYLLANSIQGYVPKGTFLVNTISKVSTAGYNIVGEGTFKATGSLRDRMFEFTDVEGDTYIDGVTFDGNNLVSRVLTIENENAITTALADIIIGEKFKLINAKQTTGFVSGVGLYIHGGFNSFSFSGSIDSVDSSLTTGANTSGINVAVLGGSEDYTRTTVITSTAKISNVKNDNSSNSNADGIKVAANAADLEVSFTVADGATFNDCEGRSIKSQVVNTYIGSVNINRSAYDGIVEIDMQYGGTCSGAKVTYDGYSSTAIINASLRPSPLNPHITVSNCTFRQLGSPATSQGSMVGVDVTDGTLALRNVTVERNRVFGDVDNFVTARVADVTGNRVIMNGNWAETINTGYIQSWRFGSGTPKLRLVANDNASGDAAAVPVELINTEIVPESWENNHNINNYKAEVKVYLASSLTNVTGDGTNYNILFDTVETDPLGIWSSGNIQVDYDCLVKYTVKVEVTGITGMTDIYFEMIRTGAGTVNDIIFQGDAANSIDSNGTIILNGTSEIEIPEGDYLGTILDITGGAKVVDVIANGKGTYLHMELIPT